MAECKLSHPSLIDKSDDLFHIQGREREKGRERRVSTFSSFREMHYYFHISNFFSFVVSDIRHLYMYTVVKIQDRS